MFAYAKVDRHTDRVAMIVRGGPAKALPEDTDDFYYLLVPADLAVRGEMKVVNGKFVPCTAREKATVNSIKAIRHNELVSTDFIFGGDSPFTEEQKAVWMEYRKALRDITDDGETVDKMVSRFPIRPDGKDPIKDLR